jgi:hypothetical protein
MLEHLAPEVTQLAVVRLAAVSDTLPIRKLLSRGISPESFPEILGRLRNQGVVIESTQLIDKVFEPSTDPKHTTPFAPTRFTDGKKAVFYSTIEDETAIEEVRYHQERSGEFKELKSTLTAAHRYFHLYETDFDGTMLDLFPIHANCPALTSKDESGYPKCRQLAEEARTQSANALRTPSARLPGGTCTPVFDRHSLGDVARSKRRGRFMNDQGNLVFRDL